MTSKPEIKITSRRQNLNRVEQNKKPTHSNFLITLKKAFNSSFSFLSLPLYVLGKCSKVARFRVILLSLIIFDKYCLHIDKSVNLLCSF
jgi:hypothetical protein